MIIFNGVSSDEVGVIVEHYPSVVFPRRRVEVFQIPGRNGDHLIDQEVYDNYDQSYSVFFDSKYRGGLEAAIPRIASWLLSGTGYGRLEDSYYPEFYRMAYVPEVSEFLTHFNDYGRGTLAFNCMPERWYKFGETESEIENGGVLHNPSGFRAKPLIRWTGGPTQVTFTYLDELAEDYISPNWVPGMVGGSTNIGNPGVSYTFELPYNSAGYNYIDTKDHTKYRYSRSNSSQPYQKAYLNDFSGDFEQIYLSKETKIEWDSNAHIYLVPRWWSI